MVDSFVVYLKYIRKLLNVWWRGIFLQVLLFDRLNLGGFPLNNQEIKNAKKLLHSYGNEHNPESDNPSTRVHLLVEVLNALVKSE